ncbi:MAG: hypothetical protein ACJA1A_002171 [Saprospiraceae bacterium]|jgi:hypothetical protein
MSQIILLTLSVFFISCKETKPKSTLEKIFDSGTEGFKKVISEKDKYEVQILFSPITESENGVTVEDHFFNFRPDDYFYPASTVKMPVAFLALQKLEELQKAGVAVNRNTHLTIDSLRTPQTAVSSDTSNETGFATIAHYIDKLFVVSDDDAYNRLFEFTSQDYINSHLRNKGIFTNSRIVHRVGVGGFSFDENRWVPSINFLDNNGESFHTRQPTYAQSYWLTPISKTSKGIAYIDPDGNKIESPFDFSQKNFININDLQESLKRLILPRLYPVEMQYNIGEDDRSFVLESMATLPKDHSYLKGKTDEFYDSYVKFFLFGDNREPMPDHIIIRNKVGVAYGYLTDCAYIQDTKNDIEFFLTATVHVNENQTYNDGIYEYEEIGIPFLAELGSLIHQYMINKKLDNDKI